MKANAMLVIFFKGGGVFFNLMALVFLTFQMESELAKYVSMLAFSIVLASILDCGDANLNLKRTYGVYCWYQNLKIDIFLFVIFLLLLSLLTYYVSTLWYSGFTFFLAVLFMSYASLFFNRIRVYFWRTDRAIKSIVYGEFFPSLFRFISVLIWFEGGFGLWGFVISFYLLSALFIFIKKSFLLECGKNIFYLAALERKSIFSFVSFSSYILSIFLSLRDQIVSIMIPSLPSSQQVLVVYFSRVLTVFQILLTPVLVKINSMIGYGEVENRKKYLKWTIFINFTVVYFASFVYYFFSGFLGYGSWDYNDGLIIGFSLIFSPLVTYLLALGKTRIVLFVSLIIVMINIFWWM